MTFTEFETAINNCAINCDDSQQGKYRHLMNGFDLFDRWRRDEDMAYIAQLDNPDFDMSPAAFSRAYNQGLYQTA